MKITIPAFTCLFLAARTFGAIGLHHYTFDGPGVVDSVGGADGALINGAAVASGLLTLDGIDDYVQFSQNLIPLSGGFSVSFFAQQLSAQTGFREIISPGFSGSSGFYVGHDLSHIIRVGDSWGITSVAYPSDGLTHHFAVTSDASETHLYIDGSLVDSTGPITIAGSGTATRLGRQFGSIDEFFHGTVDDLRIFSGTLSSSGVASLAAIPEPPSLPLLLLLLAPLFLRSWSKVG